MSFKDTVKKSFQNVKRDIVALRQSMNEWVLFLNSNQADLKIRVIELERKVRKLESEKLNELEKIF